MKIPAETTTLPGGQVEKKKINQELWQACAGPLLNLPAAGTHVVYFPQGHSEQVAASMKKDVDGQIPNYPNLPSKLLCMLHNVTLHADPETDEVYAQMTLQPVPAFDRDALLRSDLSMKVNKPQTEFFCKTLTASDTSTHGGFSVPRRAAEKIFPPLDFTMQPPAQELVARDLHDNAWTFRHIYRGQPKRHLLTTGWSLFVSGKRLFAGDSVLFIRDEKQQLLLGIRRANRQPTNLSSSVLSSDSMHIGILAAAAHAAANNSPFTVFYNPRASPSEFVIPLAKYYKAACSNQISLGMRFRMMFETEESGTRRYMGTITGISDLDSVRWKNSQWRNLQVGWDESTVGERRTRVSIWEIEPVTAPFFICPTPSFFRSKRSRIPGMPDEDSSDLDSLFKRTMPWLGDEYMKDTTAQSQLPGLSLVQWMNMQQQQPSPMTSAANQTNYMNSVLQNLVDPARQLGFPPQPPPSQVSVMQNNNIQFIGSAQKPNQQQQQQQQLDQFQKQLPPSNPNPPLPPIPQHPDVVTAQQTTQNFISQNLPQSSQFMQSQTQQNILLQQQQQQQQQSSQNQQLHRNFSQNFCQAQQIQQQQQQQQASHDQVVNQQQQQQQQQQLNMMSENQTQLQLFRKLQQQQQQALLSHQQQQQSSSTTATTTSTQLGPPQVAVQQQQNHDQPYLLSQRQMSLDASPQISFPRATTPTTQLADMPTSLPQPHFVTMSNKTNTTNNNGGQFSHPSQQQLKYQPPQPQQQSDFGVHGGVLNLLANQLSSSNGNNNNSFWTGTAAPPPTGGGGGPSGITTTDDVPSCSTSPSITNNRPNSTQPNTNPKVRPSLSLSKNQNQALPVVQQPAHPTGPQIDYLESTSGNSVCLSQNDSHLHHQTTNNSSMTFNQQPVIYIGDTNNNMPRTTNSLQFGENMSNGHLGGMPMNNEPLIVIKDIVEKDFSNNLSSGDGMLSNYDVLNDTQPQLSSTMVSPSFGVPDMAFGSIDDSTINDGSFINSGAWAPAPQFQRMRTYTKVHKRGAVGRSIEVSRYVDYEELKQDLARMFGIEGQLEDRHRVGWKLVYVDHEGDVLLVGDDPWEEFVNCVRCIKILSPQEVQAMSLDGDFGNNVLPNQAGSSSDGGNL